MDDYVAATYKIPSITSEIGYMDQFLQDWVVKSKEIAFDIVRLNQKWLDYVYLHLPEFSEQLAAAQKKWYYLRIFVKYRI